MSNWQFSRRVSAAIFVRRLTTFVHELVPTAFVIATPAARHNSTWWFSCLATWRISAVHQVIVARLAAGGGVQRGIVILKLKKMAGDAVATTSQLAPSCWNPTRSCGIARVTASARPGSQRTDGPLALIERAISSGVEPVTRYVVTVAFGPKKA